MGKMNDIMAEEGLRSPIKLDNPITINNQEVAELSWSADDLTLDLYNKAQDMAGTAPSTQLIEFDAKRHPYLAQAMIIAVNPQIDFMDLKQIKGSDIFKLAELGRFLALRSKASTDESLDGSSDTTPESSPRPSTKSKGNQS